MDKLIANGELLEWAEFAGNRYGTPRAAVLERLEAGEPVLLEIDLQGARQVRESMPEAQLVFLAPPSWSPCRAWARSAPSRSWSDSASPRAVVCAASAPTRSPPWSASSAAPAPESRAPRDCWNNRCMSERPRLTVLSGPSGVGKSTVVAHMRKEHPEVWLSVSATTRRPRPGE